MSGGRQRSRRGVMYGLVAAQLLVLAAIVAPQELNRALDAGTTVELEILQARPARDAFRGAYLLGHSAVELEAPTVPVPAGLRGGDPVVVTFAVETGRTPRIVAVDRGRRPAPFTPTSFSVAGRVVEAHDARTRSWRERPMWARVGKPAVLVDLNLPASIAVDDAALALLAGGGMVRARLHGGYLGRPYFGEIRLAGRTWTAEARFLYDEARGRLVVLAPRDTPRRMPSAEPTAQTDVFSFDATGKELGAVEVPGRLVDGLLEADGSVLALVAAQRWSPDVSLARVSEAGQVTERSVPIALDRILGFDAATSSVWVKAAPATTQPPHFVQRFGLGGLREPRLGPFDSVPAAVLAAGGDVWVLEPQRHRITRLDAASGRVVREYQDLNNPGEMAVDAGILYVVEADRTQLTALAEDGRVLWRRPRFQGVTWIVSDPVRGGGWVGVTAYEREPAGVLRFERDGAVTRVTASSRAPLARTDSSRRIGAGLARATRDGRLVYRESEAIAILSADGATLARIRGFRFPEGPRLRS